MQVCPASEKVNGEKTGRKAINMIPMLQVREREIEN